MTPGERTAAHKILTALAAGGWRPTYTNATNDGGEEAIDGIDAALESIESVDACSITFYKPGCVPKGVLFVLGNAPDGGEVAADWTYSEKDDFNTIMDDVTRELMP